MSRHVVPLRVHPLTVDGTCHDRATGHRTAVTARRTGVTMTSPLNADVYELYAVEVPCPRGWHESGRVHVRFDAVPAWAAFDLRFLDRPKGTS